MCMSMATDLLLSPTPVDEYEIEIRLILTREEMIDRFRPTVINTGCSATRRQQRCHVRRNTMGPVPPNSSLRPLRQGKNKRKGGGGRTTRDTNTNCGMILTQNRHDGSCLLVTLKAPRIFRHASVLEKVAWADIIRYPSLEDFPQAPDTWTGEGPHPIKTRALERVSACI